MSTVNALLAKTNNHVLTLTLNQPDKRNVLSFEMLTALRGQLLKARADASIRVIVIAANGPAFCAGHDLKELTSRREDADKGKAFFERTLSLCAVVMQAIVYHPKPVMAKVDGMATAAGCQLVASCDLAIASQHSRFCTPGVNIGLFCSTPMVALSRNIPRKQALEMLLVGDAIDAQTAQSYGLINHSVAPEHLDEAIANYCQKLCDKSALTLSIGKRAFYLQAEMSLSDAYDYASEVMVRNMLNGEAIEGIGAFIEKRKPDWQWPEEV